MKGNNKIILNQSEMIRAVEYYLNMIQFKEPVCVAEVSENKSLGVFEVSVTESDDTMKGVRVTSDPGVSVHG